MDAAALTEDIYTVIRIPATSPRIDELVTRFREVKLAALKADPTAFLNYEVESKHPDPVWKDRLDAKFAYLVCVKTTDPDLSPEDALLSGDWAGYSAVRERVSIEEYYAHEDMGQPVPDHPELETRWHIYDLYTMPAHRGRNVAKKLIDGCIALVERAIATDGADSRRARIRLMVNPANVWLVKWYGKFGFKDSGMATLRQGFTANGWENSVPANSREVEELRNKWEKPYGLIMEVTLDAA
jgi:ribosomal protein S18 acetylase RimI-like enzyme